MKISASLKFYGLKIHRYLVYIASVALFAYALSGITHPIMAWFGTQQVQYMPPALQIDTPLDGKIAAIIDRYNIKNAKIIKIVPIVNNKISLQITQDFFAPRRYFDIETATEIMNYDQKQAVFLATHYTGIDAKHIKDIIFQTEFDSAYNPINQLLPVYKITYDTKNHISAYVDTEISQLAYLGDDFKQTVQQIFTQIHTLAFLDNYPILRVGIILILLIALLTTLITGVILLYKMQRRNVTDKPRYIHRYVAHFVWIPLFFMIISGIYHLLHSEFASPPQKARLVQDFQINHTLSPVPVMEQKINDISMVLHENNLYYRISVADKPITKGEHDGHDTSLQNKKFDGIPREKNAVYVDAHNGEKTNLTDIDFIKFYAKHYSDANIKSVSELKFFGFGYDFRNKRLPVFKVMLDTQNGDILFIDPATGMLVARSDKYNALENLSFSFLHKWNFALMFTSRQNRDFCMVGFLVLLVVMTILGIKMKLNFRKNIK